MKTVQASALSLLLLASCDRHPTGGDAGLAAASRTPTSAAAAEAKNDPSTLREFEGEISLVAKGATTSARVPLNLLIKNDTIRIDVPADLLSSKDTHNITGGGKVYVILRTPEKKVFVVLDGKQEAVAIDLDQMGDKVKAFRGPRGGADTPPADPPKVVKTGRKETIAGYTCEDWDIINPDRSKMSACVAEMGTSFFHLPLTGIPTEHAWALELADGKHFPLKGVAYGKDGVETGRVEVTKLDKHTLDASQFEVPMGYKQVTIEEMIHGMAGGGDIPKGLPPHGGHHGRHHGGR